eukprot:scaffold111_cov404-Prasinococcus_capsulatus_cf.AAC.27
MEGALPGMRCAFTRVRVTSLGPAAAPLAVIPLGQRSAGQRQRGAAPGPAAAPHQPGRHDEGRGVAHAHRRMARAGPRGPPPAHAAPVVVRPGPQTPRACSRRSRPNTSQGRPYTPLGVYWEALQPRAGGGAGRSGLEIGGGVQGGLKSGLCLGLLRHVTPLEDGRGRRGRAAERRI